MIGRFSSFLYSHWLMQTSRVHLIHSYTHIHSQILLHNIYHILQTYLVPINRYNNHIHYLHFLIFYQSSHKSHFNFFSMVLMFCLLLDMKSYEKKSSFCRMSMSKLLFGTKQCPYNTFVCHFEFFIKIFMKFSTFQMCANKNK